MNDEQTKELREKLYKKGWSKLRIASFIAKFTSVSLDATNKLCSSCRLIAWNAALNNRKTAKYCKYCTENYRKALQPLVEELNK